MRHNQEYYKTQNPDCCPKEQEPCVPQVENCGTRAQREFKEYMEQEKCKPEYFEPFDPKCFDWTQSYLGAGPRNVKSKT